MVALRDFRRAGHCVSNDHCSWPDHFADHVFMDSTFVLLSDDKLVNINYK